jgi:hypothetical protein
VEHRGGALSTGLCHAAARFSTRMSRRLKAIGASSESLFRGALAPSANKPPSGDSANCDWSVIRRLSTLDAVRCAENATQRLTDCVFCHSTSDFIADGTKNDGMKLP